MTIYDFIGICGVALSIYCYARLQWHRDYAKRLSYSVLNLIAVLMMGASLVTSWNLASFICDVVWGLISLYGIYRCSKYIWRERMLQKRLRDRV